MMMGVGTRAVAGAQGCSRARASPTSRRSRHDGGRRHTCSCRRAGMQSRTGISAQIGFKGVQLEGGVFYKPVATLMWTHHHGSIKSWY
jgi:hypothetical protein